MHPHPHSRTMRFRTIEEEAGNVEFEEAGMSGPLGVKIQRSSTSKLVINQLHDINGERC
jgi:hypothetical protein